MGKGEGKNQSVKVVQGMICCDATSAHLGRQLREDPSRENPRPCHLLPSDVLLLVKSHQSHTSGPSIWLWNHDMTPSDAMPRLDSTRDHFHTRIYEALHSSPSCRHQII